MIFSSFCLLCILHWLLYCWHTAGWYTALVAILMLLRIFLFSILITSVGALEYKCKETSAKISCLQEDYLARHIYFNQRRPSLMWEALKVWKFLALTLNDVKIYTRLAYIFFYSGNHMCGFFHLTDFPEWFAVCYFYLIPQKYAHEQDTVIDGSVKLVKLWGSY